MSVPVRVPHDQLELGDEQLVIWNGKPFTGIAVEGDSEVSHVAGLIEGVTLRRYKGGGLAETSIFWQGARHGLTTQFDRDGRRRTDELYEFGILAGRRIWATDGRMSSEWAIGPRDDQYRLLELSRRRFGGIAPPVDRLPEPLG